MLQYVSNILAPTNLTKVFPQYDSAGGFEIVGFGWDQGWNDGCTVDDTAEYEQNLVNLIKDLRKACKHFVLVAFLFFFLLLFCWLVGELSVRFQFEKLDRSHHTA